MQPDKLLNLKPNMSKNNQKKKYQENKTKDNNI